MKLIASQSKLRLVKLATQCHSQKREEVVKSEDEMRTGNPVTITETGKDHQMRRVTK